ncbi:MAG: hypothetical protein M5R36_20735 [Deltaproteobacteria bacterium]|nr:hypothetical protein [Deltaproteobacteria bacterium]
MSVFETTAKRVLMGRLDHGAALPDALYDVARKHDLAIAEVRALGAVRELEVTEWDPEKKTIANRCAARGLAEVLMLYGNLSRKTATYSGIST